MYFAGLFTSYLWSALGFHFGDSVWHLLVAGVPVIVSSGLMILVSGVAVSRYREAAPITGRRVVRGWHGCWRGC